MVRSAEPTQLDTLAVLNLFGVGVAPFDRDIAVSVCVDEHVECAVTVELRQEGDGSGDLSENGGDLGLDFGLGFVRGGGDGGAGAGIFLVGGSGSGAGGFGL